MQVLMTHPDHGKLHVYDQTELAANEARGWTAVYDAPVTAEPALPAAATPNEDVFGEEDAEQVAPPAAIPSLKKRK